MTRHDRREFLKRLAQGTAYAAPIIYSMVLPERLMASHKPSHQPPGMGAAVLAEPTPTGDPIAPSPATEPAPWDAPPPGSRKP